MKNQNVAIRGADLIDRLIEDYHYDISTVLGMDESAVPLDSWWVVMWPEHVRTPRYNSDADYHGPFHSRQEALDYRPDTVEYAS